MAARRGGGSGSAFGTPSSRGRSGRDDDSFSEESDSDADETENQPVNTNSEDQLRGHIKQYLQSSDIKQKIHSILHHEGGRPYRDGELLSRLQQREIVDEIVKTLQTGSAGEAVGSGSPPVPAGDGARILLRLRGGVAFSDALRLSAGAGDEDGLDEGVSASFIQMHICYAGQRCGPPLPLLRPGRLRAGPATQLLVHTMVLCCPVGSSAQRCRSPTGRSWSRCSRSIWAPGPAPTTSGCSPGSPPPRSTSSRPGSQSGKATARPSSCASHSPSRRSPPLPCSSLSLSSPAPAWPLP